MKLNTSQSPGITSNKIKEAVKSAVCEEDRSRNVLIFGKEDLEGEDLNSTVSEIFLDLEEKPQIIDCRRLGTARPGECRPIKVKLSCSDAVSCLMKKAKMLKSSERNKTTYLSEDRNKEERDLHKKLVALMKLKIKEEPEFYHFIKGGLVSSVRRKEPPVNRS